MKWFYKEISLAVINRLNVAEQQKCESLIRIVTETFASDLNQLGLTLNFNLYRWVDTTYTECGKDYDGYTATFEAVVMQNGTILKAPNDDAEYVFFANISNICYIPIKKKYAIYFLDEIDGFLKEISLNIDDIKRYFTALGSDN